MAGRSGRAAEQLPGDAEHQSGDTDAAQALDDYLDVFNVSYAASRRGRADRNDRG